MQPEENDPEIQPGDEPKTGREKINKVRLVMSITLLLFPFSVLLNVYLLGGFGNRVLKKESVKTEKDSTMEALKSKNVELLEILTQLQPQLTTPEGIFFEVQLGAFQNFNLDEYLSELAAIRQERHDEKNKLLLGRFTDLNKALRFENDLKRIGVSGAFIVGRIDGALVSKEAAIQAFKERNK